MTGFRRAERRKVKFRIGIDGPSGCGKTYSSIELAKGFVRGQAVREDGSCRIGIINTEREGAETYADHPEIGIPFDTFDLRPLFTAKKYLDAIREGAKLYDVLIIDSLSHAWSGEGGILEATDKAAAGTGGNKWAAWAKTTPQHNAIINAILQADCHVICTLRAKTAWEVQDDGGKKKPVKIGLAPDQRAGIEYEFTLVMDIAIDGHIATTSKDRTGLLDGTSQRLTPAIGEQLMDWMEKGIDAPPPTPAPKTNGNAKAMLRSIYDQAQVGGVSDDGWKILLKKSDITKDKNTWTSAQLAHLRKLVIEEIEKLERSDDVPMPEEERLFASEETLEILWKTYRESGLARSEEDMIRFIKMRFNIIEDLKCLENLTEEEARLAIEYAQNHGTRNRNLPINGNGATNGA